MITQESWFAEPQNQAAEAWDVPQDNQTVVAWALHPVPVAQWPRDVLSTHRKDSRLWI